MMWNLKGNFYKKNSRLLSLDAKKNATFALTLTLKCRQGTVHNAMKILNMRSKMESASYAQMEDLTELMERPAMIKTWKTRMDAQETAESNPIIPARQANLRAPVMNAAIRSETKQLARFVMTETEKMV